MCQNMTYDVEQVLETFAAAGDENKLSSMRKGQVVTLPEEGEVWMTGDIHDHRNNFRKFVEAANLAENPQRHVVLHELIHGDHYDSAGAEDSWQMLYQSADLKANFPSQVHFLLANHDLAQIHGEGIMKAGLSVCEAFNNGVKRDFKDRGTSVTVAITEYLLTLPLAIRSPSGLFFCHSLPTDSQMKTFDFTVFDRDQLKPEDYRRKYGPIYQLIWGRGVTPVGVDEFAEKVGAKMIVTGHQPQEMGYAVNGTKHLIIASDHNHGVMLPLNLAEQYDMDAMVNLLTKFVALGAEEG